MRDTGAAPKFERKKISIDEVKAELDKAISELGEYDRWTIAFLSFMDFLCKLDWNKTEIYFEKESSGSGGRSGWRVVHFHEKIEEKWHDTFSTWFGLSAWMH